MALQVHSSHRAVITAIDTKWRDGMPFSIQEVHHAAHVSTSSVTRCLTMLVHIKLVTHKSKGYKGRHYRVANRWTNKDEVMQAYHFARVLNI